MPELPEVEIARRNLERWWEGRAADEVALLDEKLLEGTEPDELVEALEETLVDAGRRGKYLLMEMADGSTVMFHFRMTGKIVRNDEPESEYARLSWRLPEIGWLCFVDMRRLGDARVFEPGELENYESLAEMGPDPMEMSAADWREVLPERRMFKTAVMDQSVVAGLGNIAASELLWRLQLPPRVKRGDLSDEDLEELASTLPRYIESVIAEEADDEIIYIEEDLSVNPFQVYRRQGDPCPRCDAAIAKKDVGGRSTYFCPECQGEVS